MSRVDAAAPIETDALVVGAGPVGLFQVFELGLLEVGVHVVDSLPAAGGQCIELYADKPIYDIPALPFATGRELVERLLKQIEPFRAPFHLGQQVDRVARRGDGRFDVETSAGTRFVARAIVVAGGAGSFQPRPLKVDGLDRHRGTQLFHHLPEARHVAGRRVLVVGGGAAAVEAAITLAADAGPRVESVVLMHRRDDFVADAGSLTALQALRDAGRVRVVAGQAAAIEEADGVLTGLRVVAPDGSAQTLPLDALLVLLGISPTLGPIGEWGLGLERRQVVVDTGKFETSTPAIFAVGDIATYPGKRRLIVSGFHEATLAAYGVAGVVHPERAQPLLYTTTSPRLHRLLGVAAADPAPRTAAEPAPGDAAPAGPALR